jgi:hypothetical protein
VDTAALVARVREEQQLPSLGKPPSFGMGGMMRAVV